MTIRFFSYILLIAAIVSGCSQVTRVSNMNMAHSYHMEKRSINPVYHISHVDERLSLVSMEVNTNQLFYVRDAREEFFLANYQLTLSLYTSFEKRGHTHTEVRKFTDTLYIDENRLVKSEITIPLAMGNSYNVFILFEDLNRRTSETTLLTTDKRTIFSEGFFTASAVDDTSIYFPPFHLPANKEFVITHARAIDFSLEVQRYPLFENIPTAAYVTSQEEKRIDSFQPDSIFIINFSGGTTRFQLPGNGIYRFSEPGNKESGFTIRSFRNDFPQTPTNEQMLLPLRYITSGSEFTALFALGDAQLAAERFWSRSAGNPDRAASIMSNYNRRVVKANSLFSSYLPGWQTDKGMIYIVFGPPDMVFHGDDGETWYYKEGLNRPGAELNFVRVNNFLSDNHYELERKSAYRRNWNLAVDRWRR
ncbi:MAG: GWxTD domain-containing protein [Bacteroidetes bacterium]|nr:MAG: GWxTD domain-containing protein [Bacteroidota bacterium]